jgi:hypothetical protein
VSEQPGTSESAEQLSAERVAENQAVFRSANEGIRAAAERHSVSPTVPFICECAEPSCRDLLPLTLEDYRDVRSHPRRFLVADGHQRSAAQWSRVVARHDSHLVVEKLGRAGEVAEELDGKE